MEGGAFRQRAADDAEDFLALRRWQLKLRTAHHLTVDADLNRGVDQLSFPYMLKRGPEECALHYVKKQRMMRPISKSG